MRLKIAASLVLIGFDLDGLYGIGDRGPPEDVSGQEAQESREGA